MLSFEIPHKLPASSKGKNAAVSYSFVFKCEFGTGGDWVVRMPTQIRSNHYPGIFYFS
jgi:hypothetical protein